MAKLKFCLMKGNPLNENAIEQIIGREGETATLYERRSLNLKLRVAVSPHVNSAVMRFA
jgi:hypothetical protein